MDLHEIIEAKLVKDYQVKLVFDDLRHGIIDLAPFLKKGIFIELLNKDKFNQFRVDAELGTICWPNGADIAPDTLYRALFQNKAQKRVLKSSKRHVALAG